MSLISPDSNILIYQMENRIQVAGTNQKTCLTAKNGAGKTPYDSNTYIIKPKSLVPDTLYVYAGEKLLLKKIFRVDTLPELKIQLGSIQDDTATISEMLANKVVMAVFKNSLYYLPIRILSFTTTFIDAPSHMQPNFISVRGNTLSTEQIAIIKTLQQNNKILFEDILAETPDGRTRRLSSFYITIR